MHDVHDIMYVLHVHIHVCEGRDEAMASGGQIFQDLLAQVAGLTY
jgi:predicted DNA-binding protein with PD1-like motif